MAAAPLSRLQPPPQAIASSSSHGGQSRHQNPQQAPILVNVTDLQDMVVKTADRIVREMIGDVPNVLLAAHAAVSMMTGYAAHGQFMNSNTQLQFPSVRLKYSCDFLVSYLSGEPFCTSLGCWK